MREGENETNESKYKNHPHKLQNKLTPSINLPISARNTIFGMSIYQSTYRQHKKKEL